MPNISTLVSSIKSFKYKEFLNANKIPIAIALSGLILAGLGVFLYRNTQVFKEDMIEVVEEPVEFQGPSAEIVVEIAGSVENPGVYTLKLGSRINDLLISSGGLAADADRDWVEKYINRAAKLSDGQKLYIQSINNKQETSSNKQTNDVTASSNGGEQTVSGVLGAKNGGLVNINTATFAELDALPGIGQVYGQKIIEQRPYSNSEELLSRGVLPKSTYEKIKEKITVY